MAKKKSISLSKKLNADLYDKLTTVRFSISGKTYEIGIGDELIVSSETDIHSQVERIPAVLGYFGSVYARLEIEAKNKEALFKKIEARMDQKVRQTGIIGEARITNAIRRNPEWFEACLVLNSAKEMALRAKLQYHSLKEKSMVLITRSADIRATPSDSIMGVSKEDIIP